MVKRDFEILNPKSSSLITSEDQLRDFCSSNKLQFEIVNLSELESFKKPYAFIHTGAEKDQFNGGNTNHWMFLVGNQVFDSYGLQEDFLLPSWCTYVRLQPKRLQEYGSNVCGEYCCTFYQFAHASTDLNNEDLGLDYCDSLGMSENRNKNDKIVQSIYAQEGGKLVKKSAARGIQNSGGAVDLKNINSDVSKYHRGYRGGIDEGYLHDLLGQKTFKTLANEDKRTLFGLFRTPKNAIDNQDLFEDIWQRNRADFDARSGLIRLKDHMDRLSNPEYARALLEAYDSGYTMEQASYWKYYKIFSNPLDIATTTAPTDIPIKDPKKDLTPPKPGGIPNAQPAVIPAIPSGNANEINNTAIATVPPTTLPTTPIDSNSETIEPEIDQHEIDKYKPPITPAGPGQYEIDNYTPPAPGFTPAGPGQAPPQSSTAVAIPEDTSWLDSAKEYLGLKKPGKELPTEITNPTFAEFPWNFDKSNTTLPEPLNFPIPNTVPIPEVIREGTIALEPVHQFLPNTQPAHLLNTADPVGPANPKRKMRLDGTLDQVPKKSRGAVTAFQTIQTYVPMPQEIDPISTVPFQYPQFQQLTAVPQLATMDKGFFKAGTNKLNI